MNQELLLQSKPGQATRPGVSASAESASLTHPPGSLTSLVRGQAGINPAQVLSLQPVLGNRAVQRILARRAAAQQSGPSAGDRSAPGARDGNGVAEGAEAVVARAEGTSGSPLPTDVQSVFQGSLGADLSRVRVHTGTESAEAAHAVGAKAYTVGQDIHFGAGQYSPYEPEGARLVAHEVAHTVQHQAGVTGRHNQLSVSTPHDSAEVEAERAADAMVAGQAFEVGGVGPAVKRDAAVKRDDAPVATTAPASAAAPAAAAPAAAGAPAAAPGAAAPGATTPGSAPAADTVTANWMVDWVGKETGTPVQQSSSARQPGDAASGTLKVLPSGMAKATPTMLPWLDAAPSGGGVQVGTMSHPKDKGGQVTTDINYGKPPSAAATVKLDVLANADKKSKPKSGEVKAKQRAASEKVQETLQTDLMTKGDVAEIEKDLNVAAKAAIGDAPEGYTYEVQVSLSPKSLARSKTSRTVNRPATYDALAADETRLATVTVPTEMQKLKGNKAVEAQQNNQQSTDHANQTYDSKTDEHTDAKTTESINKITTSVTTATSQAWESLKSHATMSSTDLSGQGNATLDASAGGALSETGLTIDVGKILGLVFIEDPPVAWALSKIFGTAKVDTSAHADYSGHLDLHAQASKSWSDKDLQSDMSRYDSSFQSKTNTEVSNRVRTEVTNKTTTQHAEGQQDKKGDTHGTSSKVASSTETVGVNYVVGEPYLTVTKP